MNINLELQITKPKPFRNIINIIYMKIKIGRNLEDCSINLKIPISLYNEIL